MSLNNQNTQSDRLAGLLAAYRQACPDPEPGANFMPMLWQKIEARQTFALSVRRMARAFVTAAVAICVLMAVMLVTMHSRPAGFYSTTYVEMLAAEQAPEGLGMADLTRGEEGNF
jgi:hypothetical protein